jgi:hypothetical protein
VILAIVKQRMETAGWTVEAWTSEEAGAYFEVEATKPGGAERHVVRRDYQDTGTADAAMRAAEQAALELARQCGVDVSDL